MKEPSLSAKLDFILTNAEPSMRRTIEFTIRSAYRLTRVRKGLRTTYGPRRSKLKKP
jgi:hypothetical protein